MKTFRRFLTDDRGNYAIITAVAMLPLLLAVGLSVDYSRYLSAHSHLQEAADSIALTLAASKEKGQDKLEKMANDLLAANQAASRIDLASVSSITADDREVEVELDGSVKATFMGLAGYDMLRTKTSALAERAVTGGVELALILDNTWSMDEKDTRGVRKIDALKTAANKLTNEVMSGGDNAVKISLVPYADYVNVGTDYRGASWLDVPANHKVDKSTPRVCERKSVTSCTKYESKTCTRVRDGVTETYSCNGACLSSKTEIKDVCTGGPSVTNYQWYGCIGSRVASAKAINDDTGSQRYPGYVDTSIKCPTPIIPLTTNKGTITSGINGMVINRSGYFPSTYIPSGLMWGLNALSPTAPLNEGAAYDPENQKPRKVAVLMTDGENTLRLKTTGSPNATTKNAEIGRHTGFSGNARDQLNQKAQVKADTLAICETMKKKNIEIFTVAFMLDDDDAKDVLEGCATDVDTHFFDATDSEKLLAAFSTIGDSLRVVRLTR